MGKKILVIDDDKVQLGLIEHHLKKSGHEVVILADSTQAMDKLGSFHPDLFLVDLLMPNVDGFTLIKKVRENPEFDSVKIVVVSAKSYEFDQKWAYELGANAFIQKPIKEKTLLECVEKVIREEMKVTFWGTRGTLPRNGKDFLKYGGSTSCVSVELTKDRVFIFDAGTGIVEFGKYISSLKRRLKMNLFISHPHWDHINGFPFFQPLYQQGNEMAVYGSPHGNLSLREVMSGQMESIYFPITIKEFAARVYFKEISEGTHEVEGLTVSTILLNHPGNTLGYKLTGKKGNSIAYITDNELVPDKYDTKNPHFREKLVKFLSNVDVLIHDSSFFDKEYESKVGWGHPSLSEVLRLATDAKVKKIYLSHHEPEHNDDKVKEKELFAARYFEEKKLEIPCFSAAEGLSISL